MTSADLSGASIVLGLRLSNAFVDDVWPARPQMGPFRLLPVAPTPAHRVAPSFLVLITLDPPFAETVAGVAEAAHILEAGLTVQSLCWHTAQMQLTLAAVDRRLAERRSAILEDTLARCLGKCNSWLADPVVAHSLLHDSVWFPIDRWRELLPDALVAAQRPALARAWSYLWESVRGLHFDRCDWKRWAPQDPRWDEFAPIATKESAYLNAWKAVEALIGDPGSAKNARRKISERLEVFGADPEREVGFHERIPLADTLVRYLAERDSTAGHGSGSRKRSLPLSEVVSLQAAAQYVSAEACRAWRTLTA